MFLTVIVIVPNDLKIEASGEGGGEESTCLDYDYIWEYTRRLCNVTYDAYEEEDIPKGRSFGSKGGDYTVEEILKPQMETTIGLEDVHTEQLGYIEGRFGNYTIMYNVTDFKITVK